MVSSSAGLFEDVPLETALASDWRFRFYIASVVFSNALNFTKAYFCVGLSSAHCAEIYVQCFEFSLGGEKEIWILPAGRHQAFGDKKDQMSISMPLTKPPSASNSFNPQQNLRCLPLSTSARLQSLASCSARPQLSSQIFTQTGVDLARPLLLHTNHYPRNTRNQVVLHSRKST